MPHLQWPALAHAVGAGGCHSECVFSGSTSSLLLTAANVLMVKDAPLTGISQARFHVWLVRDGRWREVGRGRARREQEEEVKEIDRVEPRQMSGIDDARSNTDWYTSWASTRPAHPSSSVLFVQHIWGEQQHYRIIFGGFIEQFSWGYLVSVEFFSKNDGDDSIWKHCFNGVTDHYACKVCFFF